MTRRVRPVYISSVRAGCLSEAGSADGSGVVDLAEPHDPAVANGEVLGDAQLS